MPGWCCSASWLLRQGTAKWGLAAWLLGDCWAELTEPGWLDAWCLVGYVTAGLGCTAAWLTGLNSGSQAWLGKIAWLGFWLGSLFMPQLFPPFPKSEKKFQIVHNFTPSWCKMSIMEINGNFHNINHLKVSGNAVNLMENIPIESLKHQSPHAQCSTVKFLAKVTRTYE